MFPYFPLPIGIFSICSNAPPFIDCFDFIGFLSFISNQFSCSAVSDSVTPWTRARQASLSITSSWSLSKFMSIESVMSPNHLILCHPLLQLPPIFPSIRVFSDESALQSGSQSIGVSASVSVLPMNTQDWSPLEWTGWISLQSKLTNIKETQRG